MRAPGARAAASVRASTRGAARRRRASRCSRSRSPRRDPGGNARPRRASRRRAPGPRRFDVAARSSVELLSPTLVGVET